jgi:hypothetical protein
MKTHWKYIIAIVILNLLGGAAWWWVYTQTAQVEGEVYATRGGLAEIEARVLNIKRLEGVLEEAGTERLAVEGAFADSRSIVHFIEKIEELATSTQVTLKDNKVQSAALPATGKELGPVFRIEVSGDFGNIYKFTDLLMASNYQVLLDKFFIGQEEDAVKKLKYWRAIIDLRMISYKT